MISKVAYGLNSVALILCILIAWEIFSTQAENEFLQNEPNFTAEKEVHDKASYQVLKCNEMAVLNF